MVKTEERIDLLVELFRNNLEVGSTYLRSDIEELMDRGMDYYYNVTALTYNRWNKGMGFVCPLLEHTDRGTYRYLGPDYPYNGILSHFPQGQYEEYIIGRWMDGQLRFTDPKITTFKEWIDSDYNGERLIGIGSKVLVERNGVQLFKFMLAEESNGSTNGFGHVSTTTTLGKHLKGKQVGENFEMGENIFEIINIE